MMKNENKKEKELKNKLYKNIVIYGLSMIVLAILYQYVVCANYIESGSMENTMMTQDIILSEKVTINDIKRYDIIIFAAPDKPEESYIKRVIGMPGDTIVIDNGKVYANGKELDDSFIREPMKIAPTQTFEVPKDSYFVLGDNRNSSYDSRYWNNPYVSKKSIKSKALATIFPLHHIKSQRYKK